MLRMQLIPGEKDSIFSSWKLESSITKHKEGSVKTALEKGRPILPQTAFLIPDLSRMSPVSVVVVDLPLVPVMPTILPLANLEASSISPITGMPASSIFLRISISGGTPGLRTIRPHSRSLPVCPLNSWKNEGFAKSSPSSFSGALESLKSTDPAADRRSLEAAWPLALAPITPTLIYLSFSTNSLSKVSPYLQSAQADEHEDDLYDPEPHDDLRFAPALQLEMMMYRGH